MICLKRCFFLLLCFKTIQFGNSTMTEEQKERIIIAIHRQVSISQVNDNDKSVSPYIYEISISDESDASVNFFIRIHAYDLLFDKNSTRNKLNGLNICANCAFAIWTKNTLFYLIKGIPLFYHTEIINDEHGYEVKNNFENIYKDELNNILLFVNKFINVLNTLINVKLHAVLSNETIVLQTLYGLKFKIYHFQSFYEDSDEKENTDDVLIRGCLDVINTFQSFIITNCEENYRLSEEIIHEKEELFGYSIADVAFHLSYEKDFKIFNIFGYDLLNFCDYSNMLLKGIVVDDYVLSVEVGLSEVTSENRKSMTIIDMFSRTSKQYELEEIYFYMKSLVGVIMAIIQNRVQHILVKNEIDPNKYKKMFRNLKKYFTFENILVDVHDLFDYLVSASELPSAIILKKIDDDIMERYDHVIKPCMHDNGYSIPLEDFIHLMMKYDFKCFNELYKFLQSIYDRHYIPLIVDANKREYIRPVFESYPSNYIYLNYRRTPQITASTSNCSYIDSIYKMCLEIITSIVSAVNSSVGSINSTIFLHEACVHFKTMEKYFLITFEQKQFNDLNILKIVYNSAIILVNMKCMDKVIDLESYKRTVYLVMTELNSYGIAYCSTPPDRLRFMLYDNIDTLALLDDAKHNVIKNEIRETLHIERGEFDKLPQFDHRYFDLQYLYTEFVERSVVIHTYGDIVQFYWKGEKKNFKQFYNYVTSNITLNSRFLYVFYDLYFKFHIAAVYVEIYGLYQDYLKNKNCMNLDDDKVSSYKSNIEKFSVNYFPKFLWHSIIRLKNFALNLVACVKSSSENMEFISKQILEEIETWHIIIKPENTKKFIETDVLDTKINSMRKEKDPEFISLIINEQSTIQIVLELFEQLHSNCFS